MCLGVCVSAHTHATHTPTRHKHSKTVCQNLKYKTHAAHSSATANAAPMRHTHSCDSLKHTLLWEEYMYVRIYMYIAEYIAIYVYIYTYIHIYTYIYAYINIYICIYIYIYIILSSSCPMSTVRGALINSRLGGYLPTHAPKLL